MGPNEQIQHFCGVETKSMCIHTRSSARKRFDKFVWQTRLSRLLVAYMVMNIYDFVHSTLAIIFEK